MAQNIHRAVSSRGQWRDTFTLYADGLPDPSTTVYTLNIWPVSVFASVRDYGWRSPAATQYALSASTDDNTGRFVAVANGASVVTTWLFPANAMRGLPPGSYEGSIAAWIADEMSEIESFRFVVQDRGFGGLPASVPEAIPAPPPTDGGTITVIVDGGREG